MQSSVDGTGVPAGRQTPQEGGSFASTSSMHLYACNTPSRHNDEGVQTSCYQVAEQGDQWNGCGGDLSKRKHGEMNEEIAVPSRGQPSHPELEGVVIECPRQGLVFSLWSLNSTAQHWSSAAGLLLGTSTFVHTGWRLADYSRNSGIDLSSIGRCQQESSLPLMQQVAVSGLACIADKVISVMESVPHQCPVT